MYVDLAYVPHHGDSAFVGLDFFTLVHARYLYNCYLMSVQLGRNNGELHSHAVRR